jgi:hypothetical protein
MYVENPKRFLYYVSKVVILYNPQSNSQQFYEGHKAKVTCLSLVGKNEVASGEATYSPCIHIWNHCSLQTIRLINTGHQWGITHLVCQNDMVLSCGIEDKIIQSDDKELLTFSVQMSDSQTG